jgi:hypothetical protein
MGFRRRVSQFPLRTLADSTAGTLLGSASASETAFTIAPDFPPKASVASVKNHVAYMGV